MVEWTLAAFERRGAGRRDRRRGPAGERRGARRHLRARGHRGGGRREPLGLGGGDAGAGRDRAVVVHDAARPLITPELIDAVLGRLAPRPDCAGVVAAAPLTDTVKGPGRSEVARTLDRSRLWAAQTPQAFRAEALREALADPAARARRPTMRCWSSEAGAASLLHEAPRENLKVTTPLDLRRRRSCCSPNAADGGGERAAPQFGSTVFPRGHARSAAGQRPCAARPAHRLRKAARRAPPLPVSASPPHPLSPPQLLGGGDAALRPPELTRFAITPWCSNATVRVRRTPSVRIRPVICRYRTLGADLRAPPPVAPPRVLECARRVAGAQIHERRNDADRVAGFQSPRRPRRR